MSEMTAAISSGVPLSRQSLETLIDLVEIKISKIEVCDREDAREVASLEKCLKELGRMARGETGALASEEPTKKRRGRRPKSTAPRAPLRAEALRAVG